MTTLRTPTINLLCSADRSIACLQIVAVDPIANLTSKFALPETLVGIKRAHSITRADRICRLSIIDLARTMTLGTSEIHRGGLQCRRDKLDPHQAGGVPIHQTGRLESCLPAVMFSVAGPVNLIGEEMVRLRQEVQGNATDRKSTFGRMSTVTGMDHTRMAGMRVERGADSSFLRMQQTYQHHTISREALLTAARRHRLSVSNN